MSLSVGGLASGLDTENIVSQLLTIQQQPITRLQSQEADYQLELTTYGTIQGYLDSLLTAAEAFDTEDELVSYTATSGDTDLFTVTADEDASFGSYNVTVQQLAEAHKLTSIAFADEEAVGEGTLHINVGSDSVTDIEVSATDTIEDVAQSINDADVGVQAVVMFDGTDYFLTLTSEETGADNVITLTATEAGTIQGDPENSDTTGLSRLVYEEGVTTNLSNTNSPVDAILTVDGVSDIHRDSNTIDDVLPGLTLTLNTAPDAPDNQSTLTVTSSASTITSKINAFVSAYNQMTGLIETAQAYNSDTGVAGVLMGDATTNSIRHSLEDMISDTVSGITSFSRLEDLGIAMNSDGQLEVDSDTLNSALEDNFDDVIQFFTQTTEGSEGFAVRMVEKLNGILDGTSGVLTARQDGIQDSIDNIQEQIERSETRLTTWEIRTRAQFNSLELLLAQYQSTGDYLSQQIASMQNLNSYIAKR
ncbi:flagellar filament capping protein FliD [Desulfocicer niacini]